MAAPTRWSELKWRCTTRTFFSPPATMVYISDIAVIFDGGWLSITLVPHPLHDIVAPGVWSTSRPTLKKRTPAGGRSF